MTFKYFYQRGYNQGVSDSFTELRHLDEKTISVKKGILFRMIQWGWRQFKGLFPIDSDTMRAQNEMNRGLREGYAYHQRMYLEDPEVRVWVHKATYF
jgi:hypothetical protein